MSNYSTQRGSLELQPEVLPSGFGHATGYQPDNDGSAKKLNFPFFVETENLFRIFYLYKTVNGG